MLRKFTFPSILSNGNKNDLVIPLWLYFSGLSHYDNSLYISYQRSSMCTAGGSGTKQNIRDLCMVWHTFHIVLLIIIPSTPGWMCFRFSTVVNTIMRKRALKTACFARKKMISLCKLRLLYKSRCLNMLLLEIIIP